MSGFERGGGAIIALPHMANWDLAGAWACLTGMPVSTVAERLRPEALFDRFVAYREALGMEVIALTGAGNPLGSPASRAAAWPAGLPARRPRPDRGRASRSTCWASRPGMPGGPAALARMTGAPMVAADSELRRAADAARLQPRSPVASGAGRAWRR